MWSGIDFKINFDKDSEWIRESFQRKVVDYWIIFLISSRSAQSEVGIKSYEDFSKTVHEPTTNGLGGWQILNALVEIAFSELGSTELASVDARVSPTLVLEEWRETQTFKGA